MFIDLLFEACVFYAAGSCDHICKLHWATESQPTNILDRQNTVSVDISGT